MLLKQKHARRYIHILYMYCIYVIHNILHIYIYTFIHSFIYLFIYLCMYLFPFIYTYVCVCANVPNISIHIHSSLLVEFPDFGENGEPVIQQRIIQFCGPKIDHVKRWKNRTALNHEPSEISLELVCGWFCMSRLQCELGINIWLPGVNSSR